MKKLFITIATCSAFISLLQLNASAQKQSRIEKLYSHIAKAETDKYDKTRERIDPKSTEIYKNELSLADALQKLIYQPGFNNIEPYFKSSLAINLQDAGARIHAMCKDIDIDFNIFTHKADSTIYAILIYSQEQLSETRTLLGMLAQYQYKIDPEIYSNIITLKENVQFSDLKAEPDKTKCETYFKDFGTQHNYAAVAQIYNNLLYKDITNKPDETTILTYFNDSTLKTYYINSKENRTFQSEVQKIYDTYLFNAVKNAQNPRTTQEKIKVYLESPYLKGVPRNYMTEIEYKKDSIDYVILTTSVDSSVRLPLVKTYLLEHKYKEFRDKANLLRDKFILCKTWTTPTTTKYFLGNKIASETYTTKDTTTSVTYNYNDKGYLLRTVQTAFRKDSTPLMINITSYKYNDLGKCFAEKTIDSLSKNIVSQVAYQYNAQGNVSIKNTQWNNNKNDIENYTPQGQVLQIQSYTNGQIYTQTDLIYDDKGRVTRKIWVNMKPDTSNPLTKQTTDYTYNAYGYLSNISYIKENLNNEKISGNITVLYDDFGNRMDPNYTYVIDNTGAWTSKTSKINPTDTEKIVYVYK